ncbi:hypothetical protein HMN09_00597500 [Mycena chlorophos]|uniref:Transmembrane protein n=1 Tax=Mycena chlorophos TaxID=658473 RepID=A0A8H6WA72_MYCCL|nr:hypothetical protein HMN09_00597500 [Mycena chlorophos]
MFLLLGWSLFLFVLPSWSALVNVTIDDSSPTISYAPAAAWLDSTACRASPTCVVPPKNVKLVDGTWHESSFSLSSGGFPNIPSTATIVFNGSAVYVNGIIPGIASNTSANIDLVFFLDGVQVGGFSQATGTSRTFQGVTVLALENIAARTHTLAIQNGQLDGSDSLLILDSIVYTTVDNPNIAASSSSSGVSGTTIAVAAVLVVFVLILLCILAYVLIRRRRRKHRKMYNPYMPKGAIKAFPKDLEPSPASTPTASPRFLPSPIYTGVVAVAMPPPIYNGNTAGNWWVGRDQKVGSTSHRPYVDLDPASATLQRPPRWERQYPTPF